MLKRIWAAMTRYRLVDSRAQKQRDLELKDLRLAVYGEYEPASNLRQWLVESIFSRRPSKRLGLDMRLEMLCSHLGVQFEHQNEGWKLTKIAKKKGA